MTRIPPLKHARSFLLSLEGNVLSDLQKIEDTDFFGSRMNSVVENIIVDWIQHSAAELDSKYDLNFERAIHMGYSANLHCRQSRVATNYGDVLVRLCGKPRYFVEQLAVTEPIFEIPNPFYQKSHTDIITRVLAQRIPKFIAQLKRQGAIDEGGFSVGGDEIYS